MRIKWERNESCMFVQSLPSGRWSSTFMILYLKKSMIIRGYRSYHTMTIVAIRKDTRSCRLTRRRCLANVEILSTGRMARVSQGYGLAYFLTNLLYREDKADSKGKWWKSAIVVLWSYRRVISFTSWSSFMSFHFLSSAFFTLCLLGQVRLTLAIVIHGRPRS